MEHEFYRRCFTSGLRGVPSLFAWVVMLLFLLFSNSPSGSQDPFVDQKIDEKMAAPDSNASSTVGGFQEIKTEVGYRDPQRYRKGEPERLLSWILIGAGVWCLIVIFLFALFHRSSVDRNWVREQSEQDDLQS